MQNNYTNKDIKRIVTQNVEIPGLVQERVEDTLQRLAVPNPDTNSGTATSTLHKGYRLFRSRVRVAAVFVILLCIGTVVTVGAGPEWIWNKFAAQKYSAGTEIQKKLVDEKVATVPTACVEKNGVKIEAKQCIADDKGYMYLLCKVTVPDTIDLEDKGVAFNSNDIYRDGKELNVFMEAGVAGYDTGDYKIEPANHVFYYEYSVRGLKISKEGDAVTIKFKDLTIENAKKEAEKIVKGEWSLDIPLEPEKTSRTFAVKGGSLSCGAVVREVRLSPIGLQVDYDYEKQTKKEKVIEHFDDGTSEEGYTETVVAPVFPNAYELKDGTKKKFAFGGGSMGYENNSHSIYTFDFELLNVVDVDNVTALYFGGERVELVSTTNTN